MRRLCGPSVNALLFALFWAVLTLGLVLGAISREQYLAASLMGALGAAYVLRVAFLGVYTRGAVLVIRDWFRTRRIAYSNVESIAAVQYSGFANRFSDSLMFSMLLIHFTDGSACAVRSSVARVERAKKLARQLSAEMGLPMS